MPGIDTYNYGFDTAFRSRFDNAYEAQNRNTEENNSGSGRFSFINNDSVNIGGRQAKASGNKPTASDKKTEDPVTGLTPEEEKEVKKLKKQDAAVRAHEQAHLAAGGGLVRGGASFEYERGPNGKQYATSGEVNIDISPVKGDPQATIQKMQKVRRAAMAPADPSAQDRAVAAKATRTEAKARAELREQNLNPEGIEEVSLNSNDDKKKNNPLEAYAKHENSQSPEPGSIYNAVSSSKYGKLDRSS